MSVANKRRNQGKEEYYSDLLIEGDGAEEGDADMAVCREKGDQRQLAAQDQCDPTLDIEQSNPTHAERSPIN